MHSDVFLNSGNQFRHAAEDSSFQPVGADTAEETLDHVEPGSGCWREMNMEARMLFQPLFNLGMLVRSIVVADQMQFLILGSLPVDLTQEIEPLDMAMALGQREITEPSSVLKAANNVVVPWRL